MIEIALITLLVIGIALFILSFFQKDQTAELEKQIENSSISLMQEVLKLKKKVKTLEEEMMIPTNDKPHSHEQNWR